MSPSKDQPNAHLAPDWTEIIPVSERDSSLNDSPHQLPNPPDEYDESLINQFANLIIAGALPAETLAKVGRLSASDFLSPVPGNPRRMAAVLSGVDILGVRAKRLQRYVRVRSSYITNLASQIEATLLSGDLANAESELFKNLNDLLEPVSWFAARRGVGASQIRAKAEMDRLYVRFSLDDLVYANPDLEALAETTES